MKFTKKELNKAKILIDEKIKEKRDKFTLRDEANTLTYLAFRNSFLEDLHAGKHSDLLKDPSLSRITQEEMKKLMIETSAKLELLLIMKEKDPELYYLSIKTNNLSLDEWERKKTKYNIKKGM